MRRLPPLPPALLLGAYKPRRLTAYQHMAPEAAVQAHRELKARFSLGIHYGVFEMADDGMHEPAAARIATARQALPAPTRFPPAAEGRHYAIDSLKEPPSCLSPVPS